MRNTKKGRTNPMKDEANLTKKKNLEGRVDIKQMALDNEQRVRVLSPSMLVFKRFIRNKLAIIGSLIIIIMSLFAFLGGFVSAYGESQVFYGYKTMTKAYASVTASKDYRYSIVEGKEFPAAARAEMILAVNHDKTEFAAIGQTYILSQEGDKFYRISILNQIATATTIKGNSIVNAVEDIELSSDIEAAFKEALVNSEKTFLVNEIAYAITGNKKQSVLSTKEDIAIASTKIFDEFSQETNLSYAFKLAAEKAMNENITEFIVEGMTFKIELEKGSATVYKVDEGGRLAYAKISNLIVQPVDNHTFLDVTFKNLVQEAIASGETSFQKVNASGEDATYTITRKNEQYTVNSEVQTQLIRIYSKPSKAHWLGTDANGMDILTRLMYGGRISLLIGFIVILIETALGVIFGGIAGYFGTWVDNLIMRIVDIFYCIPSLPLIIILGSIMDQMKIDPQVRIYIMMLVLGLLGWPGVARMVRGQILSLREQEFMTATEATGISVSRRIFKHLVPNVIPQLIVISTMGLGGIILTESTLSFLGLGVKFPFASWGNIISAVSTVHVMTNYWFVWIPAGMCILFTVLAFNFIGDGLRDAFDPKMKR
jgi:peptide/nickel transport system permease protein